MNTRFIFALIVIAILAIALSACSPSEAVSLVTKAAYSDSNPTTLQSYQMSPRIEACSMSDRTGMEGELRAQINPQTAEVDGVTIGSWLNAQMPKHACVKAASK